MVYHVIIIERSGRYDRAPSMLCVLDAGCCCLRLIYGGQVANTPEVENIPSIQPNRRRRVLYESI